MKKFLLTLLFLAGFCYISPAAAQTSVNGRIVVGLAATKPATCVAGDTFIASDTPYMYVCGPANTWTPLLFGGLATTQVAFGSATNTIAGSANFTWDNTNKSLTVTNTGTNMPSLVGSTQGATSTTEGILGQCQQLGNFTCEGGQFTATDSGAGPFGTVMGLFVVPSHIGTGTLVTMTGIDTSPIVGGGAGAITTSRGIHVGGVSFPTGTTPVTQNGIIIDDQCAGSFSAPTCIGLNIAAQSNSGIAASINGLLNATAGGAFSGTFSHSGAETFANLNGILVVGTAAGQYASLQAAHDALPSTGGIVFVTATGTPFGAGTTTVAVTKPMHVIISDNTFTYTGSAQALVCTSVNAPIIEGSGFQGGGSANGTIISVTNTGANGFDINTCPGAQLRNLNIIGPGSGTGKGLIFTGNTGVIENVVVKSFGGNGCEEDGTRGNSNGVRWVGARCVSNGGIGLNVFGANANVNHFMVEVSSNTGLGAQIATSANVFELLHGFSNNAGGTGVSFISPAGNNSGVFYSDNGTQTTDLALGAGASNNGWLRLVSGQTFTNAGTNNFIQTSQALFAAGSAATPGQSFIGSPTTGLYDVGGGAVGFSSGGTAVELFNSIGNRLGSAKCIGWSSNADPTLAANDAGVCRDGAGVIDFGNGTSGDKSAKLRAASVTSDGGATCTNGELALSAGWQSTGSATVTAVAGTSQTCMWTITTGTTTAANPTVTDTLVTSLPAVIVCEMNIHGGTHTAAAGEAFLQNGFSATVPVFTFQGTPTAGGTTYFVTRRCGP